MSDPVEGYTVRNTPYTRNRYREIIHQSSAAVAILNGERRDIDNITGIVATGNSLQLVIIQSDHVNFFFLVFPGIPPDWLDFITTIPL